MELEITTPGLFVVGDIHGDFSELTWNLTVRLGITDSTFLLAGDCGVGFDNSHGDLYRRKLRTKLEKGRNTILCVRGNHDNPKFFQEGDLIDFPHFKTLPDYAHLTWGSRKILVIGGGVSVDKEWRLSQKGRECWWEGERIKRAPELLEGREDIVVSHMAPLCVGPVLIRDSGVTNEIWAAERSDREYLSTVLKETRPRKWLFGHYHQSTSGDYEDCLWRGLDKQEIYEIR